MRVDRLPHFLLGRTRKDDGFDMTVWVCFPALYYKGGSTYVWESWVGEFYETALRPALVHRCGGFRARGPQALWKPTFREVQGLDQRCFSDAICTTQGLHPEALHPLSVEILALAEQSSKFSGAFYVVDYVPKPMWHLSSNAAAAREAWRQVTAPIAGEGDLENWTVQVNLECDYPGHVVLWKPRGMLEWLSYELPHVSEEALGNLLKNPKDLATDGPTEWSRAYVAVDVRTVAELKGYTEVRFGVEDSRELGLNTGWRVYGIDELLPKTINRLVSDVHHTLRVMLATAEEDENGGGIPSGVATIGVTMAATKAQDALRTVEDRRDLFYIVPKKIWWYVPERV